MQHNHYKYVIVTVAVFICIIIACAPSSDGPATGPDNDNATLVISTTADTTISDTITGLQIRLPQGGQGTLTIKNAAETYDFPFGDQVFEIGFTGSDDVLLIVPVSADTIAYAYYLGKALDVALHKVDGDSGWWPLPEMSETENERVYLIKGSGSSLAKVSTNMAYKPPASAFFAINKLSKTSGDWLKIVAIKSTIDQCVGIWLNNLPAELKARADMLIKGNLKYDIRPAKSNSYQAFDNYFVGKNAVFNMKYESDLAAVSHEVGHYMNHVFVGYAKYLEIYNRIPKSLGGAGGSITHDIGYYLSGRKYLLEDYAYVSEFLCKGDVSNYDPLNINKYVSILLEFRNDPRSYDYPSHEAFGTTMLLSLVRDKTQDSVYTFERDKTKRNKVPVVNAPLSDVLNLLSSGPRDVNELLAAIQAYLAKFPEHQKKLGPMLEPIGWSYSGKVLIVDKDEKPMRHVEIVNLVKVSENEIYRQNPTLWSGDDGMCYTTRVYPGESILRVFYNYDNDKMAYIDSLDTAITVDWKLPTSTYLDFKTITIRDKPAPKIYNSDKGYLMPGDTITLTGEYFGATQGTSTIMFGTLPAARIVSWNDTRLTVLIPFETKSGDITVTVNNKKSAVYSLNLIIFKPVLTSHNCISCYLAISPAYLPGDSIVIHGQDFSTNPDMMQLLLNDKVLPITKAYSNQVRTVIPIGARSGNFILKILSETSQPLPVKIALLDSLLKACTTLDFNLQGVKVKALGTDGVTYDKVEYMIMTSTVPMSNPNASASFKSTSSSVSSWGGPIEFEVSGTFSADFKSLSTLYLKKVVDRGNRIERLEMELVDLALTSFALTPITRVDYGIRSGKYITKAQVKSFKSSLESTSPDIMGYTSTSYSCDSSATLTINFKDVGTR